MRSALLLVGLVACGDNLPGDGVLIYTRTLGYRHADSIAAATARLPDRLAAEGIAVEITEDPDVFLAELPSHQAVAFLYTSGNDILTPEGKAALEAFVRGGGGFMGLHSAADTEYAWPFYQELQVAPFESHPPIQQAAIDVLDHGHPAMALVPLRWVATDEWYNFPRDPAEVPGVHVLATLDETSYSGGTMGDHHPIVWAHEDLGGRVFYSGVGHVASRWDDPVFVAHVVGGFRWILGHD